ncbi:unnamed protein product [Rotaria sp. Silwood2]|nr:unnamed protein product [Rotaria sp. Silwood2]
MVQAEINMINATADAVIPLGVWCSKWRKFWNNYEWRMRHYFYIHLSVFFCNTLLCGVIVWNIEQKRVPYLDCWFTSATCVFTCGLETYDFGSFSQASQIILLIFTVISGITVSTIPAIFIKIYRVKREITPDEDIFSSTVNDNSLPITQIVQLNSSDPVLNQRLRLLPSYATFDISLLSAGTLIIFVLLMGIKPQMLCAINETPFEMEWILLQTQQTLENNVSNGSQNANFKIFLPFNRMQNYLLRKGSITKAQANRYFASTISINRVEAALDELNDKRNQHRLSITSADMRYVRNRNEENTQSNIHISLLRMKLFLITFCRHAILSFFSLLVSTRSWLFIFIFLICTFEASRMIPSDPTITVFRVIFEVISAFGGCGFSMGFSKGMPSLVSILTSPSKVVIILVMCMGRHRGLLDSMKDQEEIEYSAQILIDSWKQLAILEYQEKKKLLDEKFKPTISVRFPTPPLVTRF